MAEQPPRYVPAETNGGWPIAAGVVVLALVCIGAVWQIHRTTYKHPTDVSWETNDHPVIEHGAAGGHEAMEHGAGAAHDSTHNAAGHDTTGHAKKHDGK
jgi:hypothetical protein